MRYKIRKRIAQLLMITVLCFPLMSIPVVRADEGDGTDDGTDDGTGDWSYVYPVDGSTTYGNDDQLTQEENNEMSSGSNTTTTPVTSSGPQFYNFSVSGIRTAGSTIRISAQQDTASLVCCAMYDSTQQNDVGGDKNYTTATTSPYFDYTPTAAGTYYAKFYNVSTNRFTFSDAIDVRAASTSLTPTPTTPVENQEDANQFRNISVSGVRTVGNTITIYAIQNTASPVCCAMYDSTKQNDVGGDTNYNQAVTNPSFTYTPTAAGTYYAKFWNATNHHYTFSSAITIAAATSSTPTQNTLDQNQFRNISVSGNRTVGSTITVSATQSTASPVCCAMYDSTQQNDVGGDRNYNQAVTNPSFTFVPTAAGTYYAKFWNATNHHYTFSSAITITGTTSSTPITSIPTQNTLDQNQFRNISVSGNRTVGSTITISATQSTASPVCCAMYDSTQQNDVGGDRNYNQAVTNPSFTFVPTAAGTYYAKFWNATNHHYTFSNPIVITVATSGTTIPSITIPGITIPGITIPGTTIPGTTIPNTTVTNDTTPPTIVSVTPNSGSTVSVGSYITVVANDASGINHIGYTWDSNTTTTPVYSATASIPVLTPATTGATHILHVYAKDNSSAQNFSGWQDFTYIINSTGVTGTIVTGTIPTSTVANDTTVPTLTVNPPTGTTISVGSSIAITASDVAGINHIGYTWDTGNATIPTYSSSTTISAPTATGSHTLHVYAKDNSSALNFSGWQDFSYTVIAGTATATPTTPITTITATTGFSDVPTSYWAYTQISNMARLRVINGYTDGTFRPEGQVTRAEFATLMVRALGLTLQNPSQATFTDLNTSNWAYKYVETVKNCLTGYNTSAGLKFKPNENALREDIAVALVRAKGYENDSVSQSEIDTAFTDVSNISSNLRKYVVIAKKRGLINGYADGTFLPQANLTRAEAAALLSQIVRALNGSSSTGDEKVVIN